MKVVPSVGVIRKDKVYSFEVGLYQDEDGDYILIASVNNGRARVAVLLRDPMVAWTEEEEVTLRLLPTTATLTISN